MKRTKIIKALCLLFICILSLTSCIERYSENEFFPDDSLYFNLVPDLPRPQDASYVLTGDGVGDDSRVYIRSEQSARDYFQEIVGYIEPLAFTFCGTAQSIRQKGVALGEETSYYFQTTKDFSSVLADHYYLEEENSYIIIYSDGSIDKRADGLYLKDAHLIKVCCAPGVFEPKSHMGDDYSLAYDYYIELGYEPSVWFPESTDVFRLQVSSELFPTVDTPSWYTPGALLKFYVEPIMDADLAMYVNDEFYSNQTSKKDGDGYIWEYVFTMPAHAVKIEFEIVSEECSDLKSICGIPSDVSDSTVKVRYESGYIGVAPGSLTDIRYSTHKEDVDNVLSLLELPLREEKGNLWQVSGGAYVCYSIITETEQYDIRIANGYISANGKHYKFQGEHVSFGHAGQTSHSFVTYSDLFYAYTTGDRSMGSFEGLSGFEFIEYPYENLPDRENLGYLETEIGRLYVYDENIFYIENEENNTRQCYFITGEKNFSFIFGSSS